MPFSFCFKGLYKTFKRPLKGLLRVLKSPFNRLAKNWGSHSMLKGHRRNALTGNKQEAAIQYDPFEWCLSHVPHTFFLYTYWAFEKAFKGLLKDFDKPLKHVFNTTAKGV